MDFLNICSMDWVSNQWEVPKNLTNPWNPAILVGQKHGNFIEARRFLDPKKQAVHIFSCMVVLVGYKSMGKDFIFRVRIK